MNLDRKSQIAWAAAFVVCAFGLWRAFALRWVSDDAFICFRYAAQALAGHGLVFNPAERVEGYSNFLWTLLLLGGMKLGFGPLRWSESLGLLSFSALIALFLGFAWRLSRDRHDRFPPVAAVCLASIWSVQSFATSGLEVMFLTVLGSAGLVTLVFARRLRAYALAGVLFSLAILTRIDGGLFYAAGVLGVLWLERADRPWRRLVVLLLPAAVFVIPFFVLRFAYYGHLLPNTYYAKSGGLPYWSQGWFYLAIFFRAYAPLLAAAPALALAFWAGSRPGLERSWVQPPDRPAARAAVLTALICVFELLYVARVGGDFMFARFLIPVTPFLCVALELGVRPIRSTTLRWSVAASLPLLLIGASVLYQHGPTRFGRGVGEEWTVYRPAAIREARTKGEILKRYLAGTGAQVLVRGSQAMLAYYAEFPIAIEGYGLTDEYLARVPLTRRGRPGHEKPVTPEYVWKRGVNFIFESGLVSLPQASAYTRIDLGGVHGQILVYDRTLMDRLAGIEGATFVRFEQYLDEYVRQLPSKSREQVRVDYAAFRHYYFDKNADHQREAAFASYLGEPRPGSSP